MLIKEKIEYFKGKLEEEKKELEEALSGVARRNPNIPGDWEVTPAEMNNSTPDRNELADVFEELENRSAIEDGLEGKLVLVTRALKKIEEGKKGKYGICEDCGKDIPQKRLEVSPSARTCVDHSKKQ